MRFKMHLDCKYQVKGLEESGVTFMRAYPDREDCYEENDYIIEIKSIEQAVELTKKLEQDLVIVEGGKEVFFFSGYYEG